MQRAISRIIRGTRRSFRESSDCPSLASEEVRQKKKSKEDFTSPKHSIGEALGLTTGLILTYEFTHRRQRFQCFKEVSSSLDQPKFWVFIRKCPFAIAKEAVAQPTFSSASTVKGVRNPQSKPSIALLTRKSIDTTPFLYEPDTIFLKDINYQKPDAYEGESDDGGIEFDPNISKLDEVRATKPHDKRVTSLAEKVTSDLFSALGAFKLLNISKDSAKPEKSLQQNDLPNTKLEAFEILEKGVELGSSRALYNIGVTYDRMGETSISKEYYKRAADLGHPLASFNFAVTNLKEGNLQEGLNLMKYAAANGVHEAEEIMKRF